MAAQVLKKYDSPGYGALLALVKVGGMLRKAGDRFFKDYGLTQCQFNVLMVLQYVEGGGCAQKELCQQLLVKGANMTTLLQRMQALGLIARKESREDERHKIVSLTPKGRRLLKRVEKVYYKLVEEVMSVHSLAGLKRFTRQLEETLESIERVSA